MAEQVGEGRAVSPLKYTKAERMWLKREPDYNERWLQDRIHEDPTILGLGDVIVLDRERVQERAGRLDLLLSDPEQSRRYELELMLGATDESHIIRCIEYWDIERRRYPGYEHCAVLVAEDITSRFLNVLALLAGTVPLIAIQVSALKVGGEHVVLDFVRVLDQRQLRRDDEADTKLISVDRSYWTERSTPAVLKLADEALEIINERAEPKQQLNYNKHYVGLTDGVRSRNFIYFRPRKKFLRILIPNGWTQERADALDEAGIDGSQNSGNLRINIAASDLKKHRELLAGIIYEVVGEQKS